MKSMQLPKYKLYRGVNWVENEKVDINLNQIDISLSIALLEIFSNLKKEILITGHGGTGAFTNAESVEFSGKAVTKLAMDPKRLEKTGKILFVCDLAREYDFTDEDGDIHDIRSLGYQFSRTGHTWIASIIPGFLRVPSFLLHLAGNKF